MPTDIKNTYEMQVRAELHKREDGLVYITHIPIPQQKVKRSEYLPIGQTLTYPKKWGKEEGERVLVEHLIGDLERIIEDAQSRLSDLYPLRKKP